MPEVFDGERIRPVKTQAEQPFDTELTLGPMLLLGAALGLILLGCLCFGLGYVIGSHSHTASISGSQSVTGALTTSGSLSKPSAAAPGTYQPQSAASSPAPSDEADTAAAAAQTSDSEATPPAEAPAGQSAADR
jgi:hypothetical protein